MPCLWLAHGLGIMHLRVLRAHFASCGTSWDICLYISSLVAAFTCFPHAIYWQYCHHKRFESNWISCDMCAENLGSPGKSDVCYQSCLTSFFSIAWQVQQKQVTHSLRNAKRFEKLVKLLWTDVRNWLWSVRTVHLLLFIQSLQSWIFEISRINS